MSNHAEVVTEILLTTEQEQQLETLVEMRRQLLAEIEGAGSPGVRRALETSDYYLFLALSYLGYSEELFPDHT